MSYKKHFYLYLKLIEVKTGINRIEYVIVFYKMESKLIEIFSIVFYLLSIFLNMI